MPTARQVANYLLKFAAEHGDCLTNLKLQKLLYYAQAWHLALYDSPLFDDKFEAWVHGPVIRPLYGHFKEFGWQPITKWGEPTGITASQKKHLQEVFAEYGKYSAWDLERMTHSESPWKIARGNLPSDVESRSLISEAEMKKYYRP